VELTANMRVGAFEAALAFLEAAFPGDVESSKPRGHEPVVAVRWAGHVHYVVLSRDLLDKESDEVRTALGPLPAVLREAPSPLKLRVTSARITTVRGWRP
jgi:hypothetical protein